MLALQLEGMHTTGQSLLAHVQVDQAQLETVLPAPGGTVMVVKGPSKGAHGELAEIDEGNFRARVAINSSKKEWFDYEDICKWSSSSNGKA